jgi:hypothetical protein
MVSIKKRSRSVPSKVFDDIPVPESAGMISFSRTSGKTHLFASPLDHQHFITMRVQKASQHRSTGHTFYMADRNVPCYVEVALSASQFAEAITCMNIGDGVPCTVLRANGRKFPAPEIDNARPLFEAELGDATKESVEALEELMTAISEEKMSKTAKARLIGLARKSLMQLADSLPFITKQYAEALDGLEQKAKTEITAYADHVVHQFGLEAVAGGLPRLQGSKDETP